MTSSASETQALAPGTHTTIFLLALAGFFGGAALRICDSLLPRIAHDFGTTPGAAGIVIIAFTVAYGFMQLVWGPLGDRYGKARVICFALFACVVTSLVCTLAPNLRMLVFTRILWGMVAAGIIPMSLAWVGDAVPYELRQETLSRLLFGMLTGIMAGQVAGGLFADSAFGWRGAFLSLSAGYAVVAVLLLLRLRGMPRVVAEPGKPRATFVAQLRSVLRRPWVRVILAQAAVEGALLLGVLAFVPAYLHQRFGMSLSAASVMVGFYAVGGLVYAMTARRIVRRFGERRMVIAGGFIMGVGYFAWWLLPWGIAAAPVALLIGFGTYLYHNTLQTHATQMAPETRGTAMACFAFCLFMGQAIGVSLAGYAFDHLGPGPLLLSPAVVLPLTAWTFARALRKRSQAA
ncbi:MAG: major facilitator superfamily protein 11 [Ramlibacter sp.]|nr:major facilitator superfamily protein 11 [Ramlibacter sp.]